jgi:hypothetical protein
MPACLHLTKDQKVVGLPDFATRIVCGQHATFGRLEKGILPAEG